MKTTLSQKKRLYWGSAVVIVVILWSTLFVWAGGHARLVAERSLKTHGAEEQGVLGAAITVPDYQLVVQGVQSQVVTAGQLLVKHVTVTTSIKNSTSSVMQISPGLQMNLLDSAKTSHAVTARYLSPNESLGGPLAAGQTTTLTVDFDMSSSATPKQFIFQLDATHTSTVVGL